MIVCTNLMHTCWLVRSSLLPDLIDHYVFDSQRPWGHMNALQGNYVIKVKGLLYYRVVTHLSREHKRVLCTCESRKIFGTLESNGKTSLARRSEYGVGEYPIEVSAHSSVYPRISRLTAADSPGHNPDVDPPAVTELM